MRKKPWEEANSKGNLSSPGWQQTVALKVISVHWCKWQKTISNKSVEIINMCVGNKCDVLGWAQDSLYDDSSSSSGQLRLSTRPPFWEVLGYSQRPSTPECFEQKYIRMSGMSGFGIGITVGSRIVYCVCSYQKGIYCDQSASRNSSRSSYDSQDVPQACAQSGAIPESRDLVREGGAIVSKHSHRNPQHQTWRSQGFISHWSVKTTTAWISLNCLFIVWFIC